MSVVLNLRIMLALQVAAGVLVAAWLLPQGAARGWALLGAPVLPFASHMFVLALQFAIAAVLDPRTPRLPLPAVLRVWWQESWVSIRAFGWAQPFRARFADPPVVPDPARPAVVLVHGYVCNRAVWRPLLASGELGGCNVATLTLEPMFGPIDGYVPRIAETVERLRAASGAEQVVLVGHSMGGLAIRAYLQRHGTAAVRAAVTLGTPHAGTFFARLGQGRNAAQMVPGSDFLRTLADSETAETRRLFTCLATRDDNLIVPRKSPLLPDAQHLHFERVGHLALIEHRPAWQALAQVIRGACGTPTSG